MKNNKIKLSKLMLGASVLSMSLANIGVSAQTEDEDTIVVTGIRQSLKASMDIKKDSRGVVDAITAEDIGKFPDTNLAESLQRITGVSIERDLGEGSRVTVRGWGADYNLVTFNNRQMPTSTLGDGVSAPSSRSFDFGNLASEAISAVEVYKTSRASVPTGGIGATINIKTTKPLEAPGRKASLGLKAVYDTSSFDPTVTPEISGIYSDTFMDDKIGVAVTASYQSRNGGVAQANIGWRDGYLGSDFAQWGALPDNDQVTNRPSGNDVYEVPQNGSYDLTSFDRERINGQLVLQFQAADNVRATFDYTHSSNSVDARVDSVGVWFNHGNTTSSWEDGPIAGPLFYSEDFGTGPSDLSYSGAYTNNVNLNNSLGFNVEWDPTENLNLWVDFHDSSAESKPDSIYGSSVSVGTAVFGLQTQTINFENDLPLISYTKSATDPEVIANRFATGNAFRNAYQKSEISQLQLGGTYEIDNENFKSIDFGVSTIENNIKSSYGFIQNDTWGGVGTPDDIPDDLFTYVTLPDKFSGLSGSSQMLAGFYSFDFNKMADILTSKFNVCANAVQAGTCLAEYLVDRRLTEESKSAYVQLNTEFDIGTAPANLVAGVRYEQTDVSSSALVPIPTGTEWVGANEFNYNGEGNNSDFTTENGSYDYLLYSLDFDVEPMENLILRASFGNTITRASYDKLQGGLTIDKLFRINNGTGNQGNPGLLPFEANNFDFSAEYYYGEANYVSVGYFNKSVKNFHSTDKKVVTAFDLRHPAYGPRADAARAALGADAGAEEIRAWIVENYPDTLGPSGQPAGQPEDELVRWEITIPNTSEETATVGGWEFGLQHAFGETGFGTIANYTVVSGDDVAYDNTKPFTFSQFTLVGLSDSANIVGYYDKGNIQARVAWNWRDKFLAGNGPNPYYREAYAQVDANISYNYNDNLIIFAEGINLTETSFRGHRRDDNNVFFALPGRARYAVGVRYKF